MNLIKKKYVQYKLRQAEKNVCKAYSHYNCFCGAKK